MPYNKNLAARVRTFFRNQSDIQEKELFDGVAFFLRGTMCCGVVHNDLMIRVAPAMRSNILQHQHTRETDAAGRPMKGFLFIHNQHLSSDSDLENWLGDSVKL